MGAGAQSLRHENEQHLRRSLDLRFLSIVLFMAVVSPITLFEDPHKTDNLWVRIFARTCEYKNVHLKNGQVMLDLKRMAAKGTTQTNRT